MPVGIAAVVASVVANVLVRWLGMRVIDVSPDFRPLESAAPVVIFTALGVGLGVAVFAWLARRAPRPYTGFRKIALGALLLSLLPNVGLLFAGDSFEGSSAGAVILLMVMHVAAAAITVWLLTAFTRAPAE